MSDTEERKPESSTSRARVGPGTWILLALLTWTLFLAALGGAPFIDRDEGEYATVAQSMLKTGDWVIPQVNDRPYYEKPAWFFWLMAIGFKLMGQNELAARLPSALSGLGLVALMIWFGRRQGGARLGFLAGLFTATSLLVVLLARVALMDIHLTLWTTATLLLFHEGYRGGPEREGRFFLLSWAAMGLAFLTKGPVGAIVPLLTVFVLTLANGNLWITLKRARVVAGLAIFLLVSGPWYVLAFLREGRRFWDGFFISQNVGRFTDVVLGHGAPLWFYVPILAVALWPWAFFGAAAAWRALRTGRADRTAEPSRALDFFLAIWLLTTLVIFSLAQTKQPNYVLPTVPALLLLAARWWHDWLTDHPEERRTPGVVFVLTALLGLILSTGFFVVNDLIPAAWEKARLGINPDAFEYAFQSLPPYLGSHPAWMGLILGTTALATVFLAWSRRRGSALLALTVGAVVLTGGPLHLSAPAMLDYLQSPARVLGLEVRAMMKPEDRLGSFALYKPTLWFYTGHHIERIRSEEKEALGRFMAGKGRALILSRATFLPVLNSDRHFRVLKIEGGYLLGDNQALISGRGESPIP